MVLADATATTPLCSKTQHAHGDYRVGSPLPNISDWYQTLWWRCQSDSRAYLSLRKAHLPGPLDAVRYHHGWLENAYANVSKQTVCMPAFNNDDIVASRAHYSAYRFKVSGCFINILESGKDTDSVSFFDQLMTSALGIKRFREDMTKCDWRARGLEQIVLIWPTL